MTLGFLHEGIVVSGVSVVSSLGCTFEALTSALLARRSGLSTQHRFEEFTKGTLGTLSPADRAPAVRVSGPLLADDGVRRLARCVEDLQNETRFFDRFAPERIGLFLGTSNSGVDSILDGGHGAQGGFAHLSREEFDAALIRAHLAHASEDALRTLFRLKGPSFTFCTACSSAAHAIAQAARAIACGAIDVAIAGGVDLLKPVALCGFESLQVVSQAACRPFARDRAGINLGEGGALFVLERARPRGKNTGPETIYGGVAGWGVASDAHHITHPEPSGEGMRRAMERVLRHAGCEPRDVGYVNAHGTATVANDAAEAKALVALFGDAEKDGALSVPAVSSTKGLHGHVLGAAGALEAAVCLAALRAQTAFAGADLGEGVAYEPGVDVLHEPRARARELRLLLSNSFGFGGNNVSLAFASEAEVRRVV